MASPGLTSLLGTLAARHVELIVVGGLAAVAQGAPITTMDLDIVHRRTPENLDRLLDVLASIDARYRSFDGEVRRPTKEILAGIGHSLLTTSQGFLDVLGAIEGDRDYDILLPRSIEIDIGGHPVHVLGLETIVELKRLSTRQKDHRMLPILEATLRERGRS